MLRLFFLFPMAVSFGFAQLDSNSMTVTSTRGVSLQADQVVFDIDVNSGLNTSLDDVLAVLQGSGITVANFSRVNSSPGFQFVPVPGPQTPTPTLDWAFRLAVPLSKIKDTVAMLTTLQQNILQKKNGFTLSFQIQGMQVSTQLLQSQPCVLSDLISDARTQAQKLADAAGLAMGTMLAMSSSTSSATVNSVVGVAGVSDIAGELPSRLRCDREIRLRTVLMTSLKVGLLAPILVCSPLVHAQIDSNSLTITTSRVLYLQPDQVLFQVGVNSALNTGLEDVVAALQGSGVTAENLADISTAFARNSVQNPASLQWTFRLAVALPSMKDTITRLTNLRQTVAQKNGGLTVSFDVLGTQVSAQLQASQPCAFPDLMADARMQAQNLAAASGLTVGQVLAIANGPSFTNIPSFAQGVLIPGAQPAFLLGPLPSPINCSIVVKFGLLRLQ